MSEIFRERGETPKAVGEERKFEKFAERYKIPMEVLERIVKEKLNCFDIGEIAEIVGISSKESEEIIRKMVKKRKC